MGDQVADVSQFAQCTAEDAVFDFAAGAACSGECEDPVRDRVEVGMNALHGVCSAIDDRAEKADQDMGAAVSRYGSVLEPGGIEVEHLAGGEAHRDKPFR